MPKWAKLLGGIILIGWVYGITHDLITAHLFPEYFTVHHPYLGYDHPIQLAFLWGVIATWPSFIAGMLLCISSLGMNFPHLEPAWVLKRAAILSAICWVVSLSFIPYFWLSVKLNRNYEPYTEIHLKIAIEDGVRAAHSSSYITMGLATLALMSWTFLKRAKMDREERGLA